MLLDLSGLFHSLLPFLFHGACPIEEGVIVTVVIVLIFPVFLLALTGDWKHRRWEKSWASPSGRFSQERTFIPASWRSSPRASSIRQASRQHWMAASFFLPVWVTSATSCRPNASSTGSLSGRINVKRVTVFVQQEQLHFSDWGHLLYPAQPAATTFVFILKL